MTTHSLRDTRTILVLSCLLAATSGCKREARPVAPETPEPAPSNVRGGSGGLAKAPPDEERQRLAAATGVPEQVLRRIGEAAGAPLRRIEGMDDNGDPVQGPGVSFDVEMRRVQALADRLQKELDGDYFVFVSAQSFGLQNRKDELSVLKTRDPYDALRLMGTNGINYDIDTARVISQLKKWDATYGLRLRGAGLDWVEADILRPPSDMRPFAEEVYAFCTDIVDQGTGSVDALAREMKERRTLYLWWD